MRLFSNASVREKQKHETTHCDVLIKRWRDIFSCENK